jgi:hypothetical protein
MGMDPRPALTQWWQRLLEAYPSKAELGRQIGELAVGDYGWARRDRAGRSVPLPASNLVGTWISRGGLPSEVALRNAAIVLLRGSGPPPGIDPRWADLDRLVAAVDASKRPGTGEATRARQAQGRRSRDVRLDRIVQWPVAAVGEVDLVQPGGPRLGSWLMEGSLPGYVRRDLDRELDDRLASAAAGGGLVVLVGDPKSGKTRTLLEGLRRVVPDRQLWSASPHTPRPLDAMLELLQSDGGQPSPWRADQIVVVLDDLQQFLVVGQDLLGHTIVDRLTNAGVLITATLHGDALARLEAFQYDHTLERESGLADGSLRIGASPRLIKFVEQAAIAVPAVFTGAELDRVGGDLAGQAATHHVDPANFSRLPEVLAAVDQLRRRAAEAKSSNTHPHRAAILAAALDAAYLYPAGATEAELGQLHGWAFQQYSPTLPASRARFDQALDWALTPIGGPGSPHALITADHDDLPPVSRTVG